LSSLIDGQAPRQFWLTNEVYRTKFRQVMSSQLMSMAFSPCDIWWVSPWATDFDLIDNRMGDWNSLEPSWGLRYVRLSEVIIRLMEAGCRIRMVTLSDDRTSIFVGQLSRQSPEANSFQHIIKNELHIKGMLTKDFWLKGSMNFTYRGTHINDEQLDLIVSPSDITKARLEYERTYGMFNNE